jgi:hypothetical protein
LTAAESVRQTDTKLDNKSAAGTGTGTTASPPTGTSPGTGTASVATTAAPAAAAPTVQRPLGPSNIFRDRLFDIRDPTELRFVFNGIVRLLNNGFTVRHTHQLVLIMISRYQNRSRADGLPHCLSLPLLF